MTTVEYLENLDNNSLRAKCLEYGLPNVPITDTSRKLLIRRLETAINGKPSTPSGKTKSNRRETIHVTNLQETKENPEMEMKKSRSNSRKSMINVPASIKEPLNSAKQMPVINAAAPTLVKEIEPPKRRSSRNSPAPGTLPAPNSNIVSSSTNRIPAEIIEEIEEYHSGYGDEVIMNDYQKSQNDRLDFHRKSRSPSLSKSPTVTTSFVKEKVLERSLMDENIEEEDDFEEDNKNKQSHYIPTESNLPSTTQYKAPKEYIIWPHQEKEKQSAFKRETFSQEGRNQFSYPTEINYNASKDSASRQQRGSSLTKTSVTTFSLLGNETTVPSTRTSGLFDSRPSDLRKRDLVKEFFSPTGTEPRNLSNQFINSNLSNRNSTRREIYTEEQEEDENIQTPYLSSYARRLSQLKAEPLQAGGNFKKEFSQNRDAMFNTNYSSSRQNFQQILGNNRNGKQSVGESFRNLLVALDMEYGIRRKLPRKK